MSDKDILLRLLQQAYTDDALTQAAKQEYEKLVAQLDEDGTDLEFPFARVTIQRENALRNLDAHEYIELAGRQSAIDGYTWQVNLRGKKYLELANDKQSFVGMNDSGKRETFATGAVRDSAEGKPRADLFSPFAMERIGR